MTASAQNFPVLRITDFSSTPSQSIVTWSSETNAFANLFFKVERAPDLRSPFTPLAPLVSENSSLVFTDLVSSPSLTAFYRVSAAVAFTSLTQSGAPSAYPATNVSGLNTTGYGGAIFDGRYVYFVPFQSGGYHGRVLRYDTQSDFNKATSWAAYDAGDVNGLTTRGYEGGVFDGRYVYFSPAAPGAPAGKVLRLDSKGNFSDVSSWSAFDASAIDGLLTYGFQGAVFDGRYVYFVGHYNTAFDGVMLRYDTQGIFTDPANWHAYDAGETSGLNAKGYSGGVFDGRFVYFSPTINSAGPSGVVLRYDTRGLFTNALSWLAYDAASTSGQDAVDYKGAIFDGHYVYFIPNLTSNTVALRYDTTGAFTNASSWTAFAATNINGLPVQGYDGGIFDGQFVYFVPYHQSSGLPSSWHGLLLRYDTRALFTNATSWEAVDAGNINGLPTRGYEGAVSDGRYIYFAPYYNGTGFSGNVLRFDARLPRSVPATVFGGSNL